MASLSISVRFPFLAADKVEMVDNHVLIFCVDKSNGSMVGVRSGAVGVFVHALGVYG